MQKDDMASAHMALGLIYMGRKQGTDAAREFMLSVNMAKTPNALNLLRAAMAYNNAGQVDQANTTLDRFLKMPGTEPYKSYADAERERGKNIREALAAQAGKK
jgi:Tfp pilus assembly protein PilF